MHGSVGGAGYETSYNTDARHMQPTLGLILMYSAIGQLVKANWRW